MHQNTITKVGKKEKKVKYKNRTINLIGINIFETLQSYSFNVKDL